MKSIVNSIASTWHWRLQDLVLLSQATEQPPASRPKSRALWLWLIATLLFAVALWVAWPPVSDRGTESTGTQAGTQARVVAVAISPDAAGEYLAAVDSLGHAHLLERKTRQSLPVRLPSQWPLTCVAFAPGDWLLTGGIEQHVLAWHIPDRDSKKLPIFPSAITALAVFPRGEQILVALATGELQEIDLITGEQHALTSGHNGPVNAIAIGIKGDVFVTGGADGKLVWHQREGAVESTVAAHQKNVTALQWDQAGQRLLSASWDSRALVWRPGQQEPETTCLHPEPVAAAVWCAAGIATVSWDHQLRIFSLPNGDLQDSREFLSDSLAVAASPDGKTLYGVDGSGAVQTWNVP